MTLFVDTLVNRQSTPTRRGQSLASRRLYAQRLAQDRADRAAVDVSSWGGPVFLLDQALDDFDETDLTLIAARASKVREEEIA